MEDRNRNANGMIDKILNFKELFASSVLQHPDGKRTLIAMPSKKLHKPMANPIANGGDFSDCPLTITSLQMKTFKLLLTVLISLFITSNLWGQSIGDYRSANDGTWSDRNDWQRWNGTTWVTPSAAEGYPGQNLGTRSVTIRNGHEISLNVSPAYNIESLTIQEISNATTGLAINGTNSLIVTNAITLNPPTGTGNVRNTYLYIDAGSIECGSLSSSNSSDNDRDCKIRISTGSLEVNGNVEMGNNTACNDITFNSNGTLTIEGDFIQAGTFAPSIGTVIMSGTGSQSIAAYTYYNLTTSGGGTKTLTGNTTINNNLTLTSGMLTLGNSNLTLASTASGAIVAGAAFSNTNMIQTSGTGYLIRPANTTEPIIFPVGSNNFYAPLNITSSSAGPGEQLRVRTVYDNSLGSNFLPRYWDVISSAPNTITATFTYDVAESTIAPVNVWVKPVSGSWQSPATGSATTGANSFTITGTSDIVNTSTYWTAEGLPGNTFFSYQTGSWNDASTWTSDPSGTTYVNIGVPTDNDVVVILSDRTVNLPSDISTASLEVNINSGGILDMSTYSFTSGIRVLEGQGTLKLSSAAFPTVISNAFVEAGGGTTEYYNTSNFTLSSSQNEYNNLTINVSSGITATQLSNITLNGNLQIKRGSYQINNNSSAIKLELSILGDVTVFSGAYLTVGTGATNTTTTPTGITGGTAPFLDYYEQFHRVVVYGDFTNNGTVRFTNLSSPDYSAFPPTTSGSTTGAASVYFMGNSSKTLLCNGTTDFYNLILDKGSDQTYSLTIQPTTYEYFRLFGANIAAANVSVANPDLMKALWIRTGTLILKGLTAIPSLTEGSADGSEYYIPANGALKIDGPDVIVLNTADDNGEANIAYNVSGTSGVNTSGAAYQAMVVYGTLEVNDGYLSMRESAGLLYNEVSSGQIIINGGVVDAKQFRTYTGTASGTAYRQNGGTFILRGRFVRPVAYGNINDLTNTSATYTTRAESGTVDSYGTFNLDDATNIFQMTGGTVRIHDASGSFTGGGPQFAVDIVAAASNSSVTGGTFEIAPLAGTDDAADLLLWNNEAVYGNVIINRGPGCTTVVGLRNRALTVLNDFTITSGEFQSKGQNVTVGGNFTVATNGTYNSSTTTTLNGNGQQIFNIDGIINNGAPGLTNFVIDKSDTLKLTGSQSSFVIQNTFDLTNGTFDIGDKTVSIAGNITNYGVQLGDGVIELNGTGTQTIGGNGSGTFENVELNNSNAANAPVSLTANVIINGEVTFTTDKSFDIGSYNLQLNSTASISNAGTGTYRYFKSNGDAGDGGLTYYYPASASFTFPLGAPSTGHAAAAYTPATIGFTGSVSSLGSVTVVPVGYEHPATTTNGLSLTYFWRVKTNGFNLGSATVNHSYNYNNSDIPGTTTESEYIAARYNSSTYSWTKDGSINTGSNTIIFNGLNTIAGDYTAGDSNPTDPFGTPTVYYSRANARWNLATTWSNTSHTGAAASTIPGANDIVVIGNNNIVNLTANASCASLQIETGSTLDIYTWSTTASNFGMVLNHPTGNGLFRLTTTVSPSSSIPKFFTFPSGDFSDFNNNGGTTEFYDIDGTTGALYILPANVSEYGNLILRALGGDNLVLPNRSNLTIKGNLTCTGNTNTAWIAMSWNTDIWPYNTNDYNPTIEKTVHIQGNLYIDAGSFEFFNDEAPQHLIVDSNIVIDQAAVMEIYPAYPFATPVVTNTLSIGKSLINNGTATYSAISGGRTYNVDVTFTGDSNSSITNTTGTPTTVFNRVIVNKGNSQNTIITCDIGGTLSTPTDNWLTLQNGTFKYMRTEPSSNFTISVNTPFTIPTTAGLYIDYTTSTNRSVLIANTNNSTQGEGSDVYLDGKLTLINGNVYIGQYGGSNNINNDIEYSGSGASEIDIQGGYLMVNGQIRRSPSTSGGILKYSQTNGNVVINGEDANTTNAKFEVLNTGSSFIMTGGTLTLVRGGGESSYGDLYLRPETSSVTGGTIYLQPINGIAAEDETFTIDANIDLNNLTITGYDSDDAARASLSINPLVLKGNLTFSNSNSYLTANDLNVTIGGNLTNNGSLSSYVYGTNLTTFNGNSQQINGTSATNFYNLVINPVTNVALSYDATINNNLELTSGTFICGSNAVHVKNNITNNATYTDTQYGVILDGTSVQQQIAGTGTFGRLELNNAYGAVLKNNISLNKNLALTNGILELKEYLLTLGLNSNIDGSGFGTSKMITTNGVFSDQGIAKVFEAAGSFTYPIGVSGKYTPANLTITAIGSTGTIRINNINSSHPAVIDDSNVLQYYWEMESSGITGFKGNVLLNYLDDDVSGGPEIDYIATRLIVPGTSWSRFTDAVDEVANTITFTFTTTDNLNGEYTAGIDAAFPNNVPVFTSIKDGNWNNPDIWDQTSGDHYDLGTAGPNGFIVIINDTVSTDANFCQAYRTTINGKLRITADYYGHNMGTVDGSGTLYLEKGNLPAGRYTDFLDCSNNSTLEFGGSGEYTFLADLFTTVPNLIFSGTGKRIQPNKDLTICTLLNINGPEYDNSVNNRMLTIQGSMVRTSGAFTSGTGADATVVFAGTTGQTVSDFTGTNAFNNLEIDNSAGLTLDGPIDITGNLLLTEGLIHTTSSNILTLENTSITCITPSGGSATSYVSGPLVKKLDQANDYFRFPVGNASSQGNHLSLRYTETGTKYWTVEYINPHSLTGLSGNLTAVNEDEYWNVSTPGGGRAIVNIRWNPSSNLTPLMTANGFTDMRVAEYDDGNAYWMELSSTQSGDNYNGSAETTSKINLTTGTAGKYTLSCVNQTKPRIRLDNSSPICGDAGIPVILSASYTIYADYTISYTYNGSAQTPITVSSFPAVIPSSIDGGTYQLTGFTYNNPAGTVRTGAVDVTTVTAYAVPTIANAGSNQSLCGATSATLDANGPYIGTGLWSIVTGTGGTVITPTDSLSEFSGTNGSSYTLRWTITNGTCVSSDDVVISFPLLAEQPENFTSSSSNVCQEQSGVAYTVPNDPSVTYTWSYTGTGHTINGTDNSITVDFDATATSGTLSVTATNTCGTSDPRTIDISVNPLPTITLDPATAEACHGAASAELIYTGTTQSPNQYSINYEAGAEAQGFADITNAALGSSPLTLVVPVAATANTYNATLTVRNSTTGCVSHDNSFTVTVHPLPVPNITGNDTTCVGGVILYETETGMTNYVWTITTGAGIITNGDTDEATVTWDVVAGQYEDRTVSVNYTDANGCSAATPAELTVRVFKVPETGPAYYVPNE